MRVAFLLFVHLLVNVAKLVGPGGSKGLLAETLLVKHQLIVLNRSRRRAPNLTTWDRFLFGLTGFVMTPTRMTKNTVVVSTATLLGFHQAVGYQISSGEESGSACAPGPESSGRFLPRVAMMKATDTR